MSEQENGKTCRGGWGAVCNLDLTKRGDVALLRRAVANDWPVKEEMRETIVAQLPAAMATTGAMNTAREGMQMIRVAQLVLMMEARNMLAEGFPKMHTGIYLRPHPRPDRRRPRRKR
ncbi:MAG TPA: hypothetical protein VHQ47_13290 [Phycisphaerae bacterium]|nr:hypothetical protein [Phycisphaerae bacterium]